MKFAKGDLVKRSGTSWLYKGAGIVIHTRKISSGWDISVYWPDNKVSNHHSDFLETA